MDCEKVCSVCFDTFKFPKLLPCKHTFCLCCLQDFLAECKDKSNLLCPLCREPCYVPPKGFEDFPTNYFVLVVKYPSKCETCRTGNVSNKCFQCNKVFCRICHLLHTHQNIERKGDENESDEEIPTELPIHLRWPMIHNNIKTEVICQQSAMIVGEFPPSTSECTPKRVRFIFPSKSGGVFIKFDGINTLFRYDKHGKIVRRLNFSGMPTTLTSGLETRDGSLIITHLETKLIYCYTEEIYFKSEVFAKTKFFPFSITELLNESIAVCGPFHLCSRLCKEKNCAVAKADYGAINIYASNGDLISVIEKDAKEYIFRHPLSLTANTKLRTISVCDVNKVTIVDYEGKLQGIYEGLKTLSLPFLPFNQDNFLPWAICSTFNGDFVVSDPREEFLQVTNSQGKTIGTLRDDSSEEMRDITALCVDSDRNIWAGHHHEGTIKILKLDFYKNELSPIRLPFLPPIDHYMPMLGGHTIEIDDT